MFRIKICGVTDVADAVHAARCGADAIGLNFYEKTPRCVSPETAAKIARALPANVVKVGVFVNAAIDHVRETVARIPLDAVQLHGDEGADAESALSGIPVIRVYRHGCAGVDVLDQLLQECRRRGRLPDALLVDAYRSDSYGGTGQAIDWRQLPEIRRRAGSLPLILAGGLTPDNVGEAIRIACPDGVDTASGVETAPGRKDPVLVERFISVALAAQRKQA